LHGEITRVALLGKEVIGDRVRVRLHVGVIQIVIGDELANGVDVRGVEKNLGPLRVRM